MENDLRRFYTLLESELGNVKPLISENNLVNEQSESVKKYQQKLLNAGCNLGTSGPKGDGVDGYWGKLTQKAHEEFKKFGKCSKGSKTNTKNDYTYSPRIDTELDFIKYRDKFGTSFRDRAKPFLIYDPKDNLLYLFDSEYGYVAHTSVVDGKDAQKDAKEFTFRDWCQAMKLKDTPKICTDDKGNKRDPGYYALPPGSAFIPKGIYSISALSRDEGYTGKGQNVWRLKGESGELQAAAIHGIPNIEGRLKANASLEAKLKADISNGKVPKEYLENTKLIANANQSFGCIGIPAKFVENQKVIALVRQKPQLFVMGEGKTSFLVQNSDDYFKDLGSDGEECTNPVALAQNMGIEIPGSEKTDMSNIA